MPPIFVHSLGCFCFWQAFAVQQLGYGLMAFPRL